ncbi:MFS transporter [Cupriavidus agavae]|uniref:Sugar phosphate permease n=1 Tax=Cupriavidus agavae TaxID=1001822 RepID=A0A4Q7S1B3_9BURK|nr:MFS transporter [Cupriavidus agavae]RZT39150.1 sugar phosphate permease [Cupriavidus agavae]
MTQAGDAPIAVGWRIVAFRVFRNAYLTYAVWMAFFIHYGMTVEQFFWLDAIFFGAKFVFDLPTGYLADRIGRKRCLAVGCVAAAASHAAMLVHPGFWTFATALVALGAAQSSVNGADAALLYQNLARRGELAEYPRWESLSRAAGSLSFAIAPLVGGWLHATGGYAAVWLGTAVAMLLGAIVLFRVDDRASRAPGDGMVQMWRALRSVLPQLMFLLLLFGLFLSIVRFGFLAQQWLLIQHGVDSAIKGWLMAADLGIGAVASLGIRRALATLSRAAIYKLLGLAITTLALLAVAAAAGSDWRLPLGAAILAHGLLYGSFVPMLTSEVCRVAPDSVRATAVSVVTCGGSIAWAILSPVAGTVLQREGTPAGMGILAGVLSALVVILAVLHRCRREPTKIINNQVDSAAGDAHG